MADAADDAHGAPPPLVLLVESDEEARATLARELEGHAFRCLPVAGAAEARALEIAGVEACVLRAEPGGGVELARQLKAAAGAEVFLPVVLITARGGAEERIRGLLGGCDDVLADPVHPAELAVRIASLLARRGQRAALVAANRELLLAQERKKQLAGLVMHDLRNPIAALLGNAQLLAEEIEAPTPLQAQAIAHMEELSEKALSLLASLLDVEELEEGVLCAEPEEVELASFAARFPRYYQTSLRPRRLELALEVEPPDLRGRFDEELVFRLIENLLDNAIRYAKRGGRVLLRARRAGGALEIVVGNDGPPVPEAEREKIFDRYYRIEARRRGARAHRGLGLYFCKLAAEAHGGSIAVGDEPDVSASFVVRLPLRPGPEPGEPPP